ncbi:MAG TPA: hypothetical protein VGJ80_11630 [Gemmatimonadales bacterium]|jgi:hypothetical protein
MCRAFRYFFAPAAFASLLVAEACREPESPPSGLSTSLQGADQAVPKDYVATPAGWRHPSCVHGIDNGSRIEEAPDGYVVTDKKGRVRHIPRCAFPSRGNGPRNEANVPAYNPNWVEFDTVQAAQTGSTSFAQITADWIVPPVPPATYASNQVYFTFPGLESNHYILQPVIQYGFSGAGGGNFWAMASWKCFGGSDCFHAPATAVQIAAGDAIHGSVVASNCAGGNCTWTVTGTDQTSGASAVYSSTDVQAFYWATGGAVEVYNLTTCNDYPANGVFYTNIALYDQNLNVLSSPPWGGYVESPVPSGVSPTCGFSLALTANTLNLFHRYTLSTSISGPQNIALHESAQYTASTGGGFTPYTYQWRSRDGWNGSFGAWSGWYSTGSTNYTFASINSCGLNQKQLQVMVTDGKAMTATATYNIFITNPC